MDSRPEKSERTAESNRRPQTRFNGIQYLRGIAAVGVVVFHASAAAGFRIRYGAVGTDLFFVISGFIMVWITDENSRPGQFIKDRVLRIVPLYWIATSALVLYGVLLSNHQNDPEYIAASFLFIPYALPSSDLHFFPVLNVGWTLNYEIMFYALFALVLLVARRFQIYALTAIFVLLAVLGYALKPAAAPLQFWTSPIIFEFLAGAWLGVLLPSRHIPASIGWAMLAGGGASLFLLGPIAVPAVLLVAGAIVLERGSSRAPWRAPMLLGNASYSIYLWHPFIVFATSGLARRGYLPDYLIFPLGLVGGVVAGLVSYKLIEEPLMRLFRRRRFRHGVTVPAGP